MSKPDSLDSFETVAVIGMAGRFPGARNIDEFWHNLREGIETISFFSDAELESAGVKPEIYNDPAYVRAKGVLDEVEMFDAAFFGFTPREAEIMDPQQRLFLECSWEALENSGYDFGEANGRVGVYAGSGLSTYFLFNLMSNPASLETTSGLQLRMLNDKDFLTTLVSYKLNLQGPSIAVQTACSTSLVAAHLACQALLDGECDMALAGGVAVSVPHKSGYFFREGEIWSPDGHCRAFDANARGTIEGNGAGVVVLKRLEDARAAGDFIHAVIRGSAINNDGARKPGYTAPSVESQSQAILEALSMAGVEAESITYVEAHGSATPMGDPIEVRALTKAFRASTNKKNFCALGSVKSNFGHLDNAAGSASLIKTIEALKHGIIPPTLHFQQPNPQMDLPNTPFYVNTSPIEWQSPASPRRAGVSSLGIGGTNAHLVLEEAPRRSSDMAATVRAFQLLLLSAKTESALVTATANLASHLRLNPEVTLADVAHTLQVGRREFTHRRMIVCQDVSDAAIALENQDSRRVLTGSRAVAAPGIVFMFPGLGDHHVGMALDLYLNEPSFREQIDYCAGVLKQHLNLDLREVLYPPGRSATAAQRGNGNQPLLRGNIDLRKMLAGEEPTVDSATERLNRTCITQPAVFVIEYALARLLMTWGLRPQALIGYSIGEYVAACLAGVFSLDEALFLVAERARLIQELPAGAMLAVPLSEEEIQPLLESSLSLSASNGPALSVIGGPPEAVGILKQRLSTRGVASVQLQTSHAFHSQMMEPILERFRDEASRVQFKPPQLPFVSNVTGTWITATQATDSNYWARHLHQTVRFAEGVQELMAEPGRVMLEVGPGQSLSTLVRQHTARQAGQVVLSSMRDRRDETSDVAWLLTTLGQLWLAGVRVDWQGFYAHEQRRRVPLPTYPFERRRYWIEPGLSTIDSGPLNQTGKKPEVADWFYLPVWKRGRSHFLPAGKLPLSATRWLIFLDDTGLGSCMAQRVGQLGGEVLKVKIGERFEFNGSAFTINPATREDYDLLIRELRERDQLPTHIAHLWCVTRDVPEVSNIKAFDLIQQQGFYSLLFLTQALGERDVKAPLEIAVVANHLYEVTGDETCCPHKATLWGPCKVVPQEHPNTTIRSVDCVLSRASGSRASGTEPARTREEASDVGLADQIVAEMMSGSSDRVIAFRGRHRWVRQFEASRLTHPGQDSRRLKEAGKYLITGADVEVGLVLADHLVRQLNAKVTLIASPEFPPRDKWEEWLGGHDDDDDVSRKIRRLRNLEVEATSGEVMFIPADVCNESEMSDALARAHERFGKLDGLIHAASAPGAGIVQLKTPEISAAVLAPKTKGTLILASLTKDLSLDFFALFSSSVSIAGGIGQVDACAANAFLDAFAHDRWQRGDGLTLSIDWSAFQWDDWQIPEMMGAPEWQTEIHEQLQRNGISSGEFLQAWEQILADALPQVVVCPQDLAVVIEETDTFTVARFLEAIEKSRPAEAHPRPKMSVSYVPPRDQIEETIAGTWQQAFGLALVGVEDNFFDLAGNSLLAIQIVTRLRQAFNVELPMTSLFEVPTVSGLAQKIRDLRLEHLEPSELQEVEQILDEIEGLSLSEVENRFAEELGPGGSDQVTPESVAKD